MHESVFRNRNLATFLVLNSYCNEIIGVDSGGQPPIIKMGAKPPFNPPIIRREFVIFLFKKIKLERKQKQRQRKNTKKGCHVLKKIVDD